jgi:hypothetical protein
METVDSETALTGLQALAQEALVSAGQSGPAVAGEICPDIRSGDKPVTPQQYQLLASWFEHRDPSLFPVLCRGLLTRPTAKPPTAAALEKDFGNFTSRDGVIYHTSSHTKDGQTKKVEKIVLVRLDGEESLIKLGALLCILDARYGKDGNLKADVTACTSRFTALFHCQAKEGSGIAPSSECVAGYLERLNGSETRLLLAIHQALQRCLELLGTSGPKLLNKLFPVPLAALPLEGVAVAPSRTAIIRLKDRHGTPSFLYEEAWREKREMQAVARKFHPVDFLGQSEYRCICHCNKKDQTTRGLFKEEQVRENKSKEPCNHRLERHWPAAPVCPVELFIRLGSHSCPQQRSEDLALHPKVREAART